MVCFYGAFITVINISGPIFINSYLYPWLCRSPVNHSDYALGFYVLHDPDYLAPGGGCEVLFSPGLSVCVSVCLSVCVCVYVCPANILIFYCSATRRDIEKKLTFICQRSRSQGRYIAF